MIAAALGHGTPGQEAGDGHEGRVEDRDGQQQHGERQHPEHPARVGARRAQAERAQEKPHEEAPGVAHEDPRGRQVANQEARQGADEGRGHARAGPVAVHQEEDEPEGRRDGREASREPVHVVQQVDGVGNADDPQDRQDHVDGGVGVQPEDEAQLDKDRRHHDLGDQLHGRAERAEVVVEPQQGHRDGQHERDGRAATARPDPDESGQRSRHDAHPAQERNGPPMPPVRARRHHQPRPPRQALAAERGDEADDKGEGEGGGDHAGGRHRITTPFALSRSV